MRPATLLAALLMGLIAVAHVARVILGLEVVVDGWAVPNWPSVAAIVLFGALSIGLLREARS